MDLKKITEISKFYLSPLKEQLTNKKVKLRSTYIQMIDQKKVVTDTFLLESYHAVSLTGNVFALFTQLVKEEKLKQANFYWATVDLKNPMIQKIKNDYPEYTNIHFVEYESKKYFELLATCEYLINDTSFMPYFVKRKEQIYINTWHGTPLKTLGLDIKMGNITAHKNIQRNLLHTDYLFMPNRFTADRLIKSNDLDGILDSKVFLTGNPRVDLTLSKKKEEIIKLLNLPTDKKLVLYAPTWKKSLAETTEDDILTLLKEVREIQKALGNRYKVLLKTHYFIYSYFVEHNYEKEIIPNWVDTNQLLTCIDKLITDYSSIFFDFLPTKKPIYFYIPDKEVYEETRGFYLDLEQLPGNLSTTFDELRESLIIEDEEYEKLNEVKYLNYLETFCSYDDGQSRKRAVDIIIHNNSMNNERINYLSNKKKIIFYCGGFFNNGITMTAINLSKMIDYDKYDVIFMDTDRVREEKYNNILKVDKRVHFIYTFGAMNRGYFNTIRQNLLFRQGLDSKYLNKDKLKQHLNHEFNRITGKLPLDIAIDFGGYNKMFTALFAFSDVPIKVNYLHAIMMEEYNKVIGNKFKHKWNLKVIFSLYRYFDKVISVSESANNQNKKDLARYIPDYEVKMDYVNNPINGDAILEDIHLNTQLNNGKDIYSSSDQSNRTVFFEKNDKETGIVTLKGFISPDKNNINFVNVGRLSPEKNQISLIEAFSKLVEDNSNCHLYILGSGPMKVEIRNKIIETRMEKHIHLLGHLENPSMFVNLCDCFILTSHYEGQGIVLLEAMIIGKPIIGTDVPGIHSVLENTNGLLINDSIDGIYQGMKDFVNGKVIAEEFDYYSYNKEALGDFYKKVCEDLL
ncbi:CDP-glycerol glycerophosphotransferase, TagB/SpsB family [Carnobacterium iners]|uniref:CDP-glycerol glycerophosphotransferase, TagB/SpsB family n=1 Tax=Carnobacterium iners TaxID=1073423 RepID=A0A1X7NAV5_9LACT|nr:glycosyltransferase [Carnobacterium iners]SEL18392.1 CDP-glycerol glycerophosphotransferase, TagB/SpsB family [Carnobacterium iners]SMH33791.1 CDP-glycerol glycerophosphotransferase, TagB/SpsB family [Carnobacterium iners]